MRIKHFSGLMLIATLLLAACGKRGPQFTQYIPKETSYVISFNVKSMVTKLEKDTLTVENLLETIKDTANPSNYTKAVEIWRQFQNAGLDWEQPMLVAIPNLDMSGHIDVQMVAGLKDVQKLEAFIAKLPNAPKIQKDKDISYASEANMTIGWNDKAVMILAGNDDLTKGLVDLADSTTAAAPGSSISAIDRMKKYFELKNDASLASVDAFGDMLKEKSDIAIYANNAGLAGSQANMALAMMPKMKDLLEGMYSTSLINFEDGKMTMVGSTFAGKKLADFLKKYAGPEVDRSLVEAYPGAPMGITAFSFKPELIPGFLSETGLDALVNMGLAQQGITADDITKSFAGDFAVVFGDFKIAPVVKTGYDGKPYTTQEPSGKVVIAVKLGDKTAVEKMLGLATKQGLLIRQGNRLMPANNGVADTTEHLSIGIENNLLVLSNDEDTYKAYMAKSGKNLLSESANAALKNKSISFWLDGEKLLSGIPESMFDSTELHERNILVKAKSTFKTLWFNTGNFDGKKITGSGELQMADGKNALPQLVRFLKYVAEETKLKDAAREARWKTYEDNTEDSTAAPIN